MRSLLATGLVVVAACSSSTSPTYGGGAGGPGANQVFQQDNFFNPSTLTVTVGTTVTWINKGVSAHTSTSDPSSAKMWDSGQMGPGASFGVTFISAGTFTYYCANHGSPGVGMHGTVVVQ